MADNRKVVKIKEDNLGEVHVADEVVAIIAGLVRTNGVLIINTETTIAEIPDSSDLAGLSLEEQAKIICEAGVPDTERK